MSPRIVILPEASLKKCQMQVEQDILHGENSTQSDSMTDVKKGRANSLKLTAHRPIFVSPTAHSFTARLFFRRLRLILITACKNCRANFTVNTRISNGLMKSQEAPNAIEPDKCP